jgi:multidrug transporter EmrE-like cation transporter
MFIRCQIPHPPAKLIAFFSISGAEVRCATEAAQEVHPMKWFLLLAAIATSTTGQVLLKAGASSRTILDQLLSWKTELGLGLYGLAAMLYIVALRNIPLSVALPCTALSYVAVALLGHLLFGEILGVQKAMALVLIAMGVGILATAP